jgi:hypothetical protein
VPFVHHDYGTQTLTTLNLAINYIRAEGAGYLAKSLRTNIVKQFLFAPVKYEEANFHTDTNNSGSWMELSR